MSVDSACPVCLNIGGLHDRYCPEAHKPQPWVDSDHRTANP